MPVRAQNKGDEREQVYAKAPLYPQPKSGAIIAFCDTYTNLF